MWTSTILRALNVFGVSEANARQAVNRLAEQGVIFSERNGRNVRWHLTDQGRWLYTTSSERLNHFLATEDDWDGRWLIVDCSVPAEQRAKRYQLRLQLGYAGFGFVGSSWAATPHLNREAIANEILERLKLVPGAVIFRAETGELVNDEALLRRGWDLDILAGRYDEFIEAFRDIHPKTYEACFSALVDLMLSWGPFPLLDPEIPRRLLPVSWTGDRAKAVFDECRERWSPGANCWFDQVEAAVS